MNDLITVEQLPIITQRLDTLSKSIDIRTKEALSMVCTEDTVKFVKAYRADLNNEKKELEAQRIAVKKEVMKPYDEFEAVYKSLISNKFSEADEQLKVKIDEVEDAIKARHADEVKEYFESYLEDYPAIDFLPFERLGLNITKTASVEGLKKQCAEFINKVSDDLDMIALQPDQAEILVEYIPTLNAAQAITTVAAKKRAVEAQRAAIEIQKQVYEPAPTVVLSEPVEDDETETHPASVAFVQYKDKFGAFSGKMYSYLIHADDSYTIGEIVELETSRGTATGRVSKIGTTNDVPQGILPLLKHLPRHGQDEDFDFLFAAQPEITFKLAVTDTQERIDALKGMLVNMGYKFYEQ